MSGLPHTSNTRSSPRALRYSAQMSSQRVSIHMGVGHSAPSSRRTGMADQLWPSMPMPISSPGLSDARCAISRVASHMARHQSSGDCSAQPGR